MEKKNLSRKEFLTNTSKYALGAAAGVAGLNALAGGKLLAGSSANEWPYPYQALDLDTVRDKAHNLYYNGKDCCSGVFGGLVEALSEIIGEPYTSFPIEVMLFGRGGGVGWGSICGALNGGAALISLVTPKADSTALVNELWGWYTQVDLPTTASNDFAVAGSFTMQNYNDTLPQNIAGSPLCHSSVSQWCNIAGKKVSDTERKERCARIAADCAVKTAEILNEYFAGTFSATFADPEAVATCLGCHGSAMMFNVMTHMTCTPCHVDAHVDDTSDISIISDLPTKFKLEQNYPNPFNPSTKIQFSLNQMEKVRLDIYDIAGRLVKTLVDYESFNAGSYEVQWTGKNLEGKNVASGIYFARLVAGESMQTIKMNLLK